MPGALVSSGGITVKHLALGAKCHGFNPSKKSKLFVCKIKGEVKDPLRADIIHSGSDCP